MAAKVYTIEIVEPLGKRAAQTLQRLGYKNVQVKIGDGYQGWPEYALRRGHRDLRAQPRRNHWSSKSKEGGRIVIPVGPAGDQTLYLLEKKNDRLERAMFCR
jgi:protein-L-isoaspartate(D-aspartate) O-methyltransferase